MELWIRSQDREILMKVDTIAVACDEEGTILAYGTEKNIKTPIGTYETKERALEVLDEIQYLLIPRVTYKQNNPIETIQDGLYQIKQDSDIKIQELSTYVYEMPEE